MEDAEVVAEAVGVAAMDAEAVAEVDTVAEAMAAMDAEAVGGYGRGGGGGRGRGGFWNEQPQFVQSPAAQPDGGGAAVQDVRLDGAPRESPSN